MRHRLFGEEINEHRRLSGPIYTATHRDFATQTFSRDVGCRSFERKGRLWAYRGSNGALWHLCGEL